MKNLVQDWAANPHDLRIRLVLVAFRLAQRIGLSPGFIRWLGSPYLLLYRIVVFWVFHIELHWGLTVGERLRIFHGYCLVIHPKTRIGRGVTLRHCVTLGSKNGQTAAPCLCDYADIGAHAVVLGPVTIGQGAVVGAGAVVTKDVPAGAVVVGNPAHILRFHSAIQPGA